MAKTIIALYDDFESAEAALQHLVDAGFSRDSISLVANDVAGEYGTRYVDRDDDLDDDDVSAGEGAGFGAVVGALVGLGVALIPGVGPILAAGPLAAALMAGLGAAAGAATGGIVAGLVDFGVPEEEAHVYAEGIRRGGTLVSITADEDYSARIEEIMNRHNPIDIDERVSAWRETGWDRFDEGAHPYDPDAIVAERSTYGSASGEAMAHVGTSDMGTEMDDLDETDRVVEHRVRVYNVDRD